MVRARVRKATVILAREGGHLARLTRDQVVDLPEAVVKAHPEWFEVMSLGAPKPQTTQVQKEEAITSPPKPKTRRGRKPKKG